MSNVSYVEVANMADLLFHMYLKIFESPFHPTGRGKSNVSLPLVTPELSEVFPFSENCLLRFLVSTKHCKLPFSLFSPYVAFSQFSNLLCVVTIV